jgi:hypothetical protein
VLNDARNNEMIVELIDLINLNCLHLDIFLMLVIDYAHRLSPGLQRHIFHINLHVEQIEMYNTISLVISLRLSVIFLFSHNFVGTQELLTSDSLSCFKIWNKKKYAKLMHLCQDYCVFYRSVR